MSQIIYVWNYREWGGAQIYFLSLMRAAKRRFDVVAMIPSDSEPKVIQYLEDLNIPIEFLPPAPASRTENGLLAKIKYRSALIRSDAEMVRKITARDGIDRAIVHIDLGFWQSLIPLVRLAMSTNVFVTIHTGLPEQRGWRRLRWWLKGAIVSRLSRFDLTASNAEARDSLKPYISRKKLARVPIAYSGIDRDEIGSVTVRPRDRGLVLERYGLAADKPLLITVGQFIERKGRSVVLDSLRRLKADGIDVLFLWLSTTSEADDSEMGLDVGLDGTFHLLGTKDIGKTRLDLLTLVSHADIFVLASLQEGLPIALVEAMALGVPCIATSVNAIPEAIEHDRNGILVRPNDARHLVQAVRELLADHSKRADLAAAGRTTALEKFDARRGAELTIDLYVQRLEN